MVGCKEIVYYWCRRFKVCVLQNALGCGSVTPAVVVGTVNEVLVCTINAVLVCAVFSGSTLIIMYKVTSA